MTASLEARVRGLLTLPRGRQRAALEALLAELDAPDEEWNTAFGPASLFDAWTRSTVARGVYAANVGALRKHLRTLDGPWVAVEIGGGDGRLWSELLRADDVGRLVVVDPVEEVGARVAEALPEGVTLEHRVARVEDALADLPDADAVVVSLTLHHVAGRDAAERAAHGLEGPGKIEILRALGDCLRARGGLGLLNEADVHCELDLAPGDPVLADRLLDSYVRRCARSLLDDIAGATAAGRQHGVDAATRARWRAIVVRWCLGQLRMADVPVAERDVYELDVSRWLAVLEAAGLDVVGRAFTDDYGLFVQYRLRAR